MRKYKNNKTRKNKKHIGEIRFYDNQDNMIEQFKKSKKFVKAIKVSSNPNMEVLMGNHNSKLYTSIFLKMYPTNKYAAYLNQNGFKEIATNIGVSYSDITDLIDWSNNKFIKKKVVIFDWDGTLSVTEGIVIPSTKEYEQELLNYGITNYEIALYYAGSINRLNKLKEMFKHLYKKNVQVYILTNNPTASCNWEKNIQYGIGPQSRINFFKLVKEFIPQIKEENILCGFDTNGFKPDCFFNNEYLRNLYYDIQHNHVIHHSNPSNSK